MQGEALVHIVLLRFANGAVEQVLPLTPSALGDSRRCLSL